MYKTVGLAACATYSLTNNLLPPLPALIWPLHPQCSFWILVGKDLQEWE